MRQYAKHDVNKYKVNSNTHYYIKNKGNRPKHNLENKYKIIK